MKTIDKKLIIDINSEIRKYKINSVLNKTPSISLNYKNIDSKNLEFIKNLSLYGSITGSMLFVLYGIINRDFNDIDLLVDENGLIEIKKKYNLHQKNYNFEKMNLVGTIIEPKLGKDVDVILVNDITYCKYVNDIRVDDIFKSISFKIDLYENNQDREYFKDVFDLNEILRWLKTYQTYKPLKIIPKKSFLSIIESLFR